MISFARYATLLRPREVEQSFAASMVGRLPIGITGLAILLLVQTATGSFARERLSDDALLAAAYSLESVLIELIFIVGPMLVAAFVALSSASSAVIFAAACGGVGTALFLRSWPLSA